MKTSLQMLDAMKIRIGVQSDYALAKHLGFTKSFISAVRAAKSGFGDENGLIVAEVLNEPPEYILALLHAERSKGNLSQKVWESIAATFARNVCILIMVLTPFLPAENAYAATTNGVLHNALHRAESVLSINYTPIM